MRQRWFFSIMLLPLLILAFNGAGMAYDVVEVADGGTISGRVTLAGTAQAPRFFEVQKDADVCGKERSLVRVDARDGFVKGSVIVLEGVAKGKPFATQSFKGAAPGEGEFHHAGGQDISLEVRAKKCNFGPFTGVIAPDQPVRFLNQDPMRHTLHSFVVLGEGRILRTLHNKHINAGDEVERTFDTDSLQESRVVRIACNRHDFMQNWLYVVKSPYFALSDENGAFTIDEVPPGRYELVAWHPVLGIQRQDVTVARNGSVELTVDFSRK